MPMLNGTLALHDVRDVEKLCRRILDNHLRKTRATLTTDDTEDALAYLVATTWELSRTYQPGLTSSFSKYAYNRLALRIVDWYRQRFYRDQTNTAWYRRRNPDAQPADVDAIRAIRFPDSLDHTTGDQDRQHQHEAPDHSESDPLAFTVRTLTGDPSAHCDPTLADILRRGSSSEVRHLHVPRPHADDRAA